MTTELRCECNDTWFAYVPDLDIPGTIKHGFQRFQSATNFKCPKCGYWMWYDAYIENIYRDLKEMNS